MLRGMMAELRRKLIDRGLATLGAAAVVLLVVFVVAVLIDGVQRDSLERNFGVLLENPVAWALLIVAIATLWIRSRIRHRAAARPWSDRAP